MVLTITSECNRQCPYCFEGAFRDGPKQSMSLADVDALCQFVRLSERRPPIHVTLLGGEPTLHPDLLDIIDLVRSHNGYLPILLLTNLTCSSEVLDEVLRRGVEVMANVAHPQHSSAEQQRQIDRNQRRLASSLGIQYTVAVTISDPDESFEHLYRMLGSELGRGISHLRIGIAAPGLDFTNVFADGLCERFGNKYLEIVDTCHRIDPRLTFGNECAVNLCLMNERVYDRLERVVDHLGLVCMHPNFDILPDFSTHWCFALHGIPELRIDNIFDYPGIESVEAELAARFRRFSAALPPQCDFAHCDRLHCRGPCPALNYYRARTCR